MRDKIEISTQLLRMDVAEMSLWWKRGEQEIGMLESVLEMFNIRHYFDAVVSARDLPYSKPHPQVYLNAAEALGVPPVQCVALEDSVNGMIACKAARMRSIVVPAAEMAADPR